MHPVLLLWDIDGTLLSTGGAGREALRQALLSECGVSDDLTTLEMSGRTDSAILMDLCKRHPQRSFDCERLMNAYVEWLPRIMKQRKGMVHPGVREMLEWTKEHPEVHDALLTGNIKSGAYIKLTYFGLDRYFEFGAFADDSEDRNKLGPIVLQRARDHLQKDFHIDYTWVIGDTPKDIACARALGCRALAVATGEYSLDQLRACNPDAALVDFANYTEVFKILEIAK